VGAVLAGFRGVPARNRVPVSVQTWNLNELDVQPHQPQVLDSEDEGRAIVINLPAGEQLQEHQVYERAWLLVADGEIEVDDAGGETVTGSGGMLFAFAPLERREVTAKSDARLLLLLAPWPGEGHPSRDKPQS
jgi:redox-sensitive bicupin YhaK (pirin superfamily)